MTYHMTFNGEDGSEWGTWETVEAAQDFLARVEPDVEEYTFVEILDDAGNVVARRTIG